MNKYQEALIKLVSNNYSTRSEKNEYINTLQELVNKETPMKPIIYNTNQFKCPKCKKQIKGKKMIYNSETKRFDIKSKIKVEKIYCPYCSTKLDWSDTDE